MKCLLLILLVAVLLTGCGEKTLPEPTETALPTVTTEPTGLYEPDSSTEQQTDGAVRVYVLAKNTYFDLYSMGTHLLVIGEEEMLTLSGELGEPVVAAVGLPRNTAVDATATGMSYYLPDKGEVVIRNPQLQIITQIKMPANMKQMPIISLARDEIFYSTGSEIRALHMETGISRMIRQLSSAEQTLLDGYFDCSMLSCQIEDGQGQTYTAYISADSGQILGRGAELTNLQTYGDAFFVNWFDGAVYRDVFGTRDGQVKHFRTPGSNGDNVSWTAVLAMDGVVRCEEAKNGLQLTFYDLATGKMTASERIPGIGAPDAIQCDGRYLWILAMDAEKSQQALYRWDMAQSAVQDSAVFTGPLYTADDPDTQGLTECRTLADTIEAERNVQIAIWQEALKAAGAYSPVAEHHPEITEKQLNRLAEAIGQFPEGFLAKTVPLGRIHISLVQSMEGQQQVAQYWEDGVFHMVISSQTDALSGFYQAIAYAIDSRVLGNSRDFDTWDQLNPSGFSYTYGSLPQQEQYLKGEERAFVNLLAMTYPHADRSQTFCQAMLPDNGEMFSSEIMQKKLHRLCIGIREAYELEKSEQTYPWEQYLQESIAYASK